jgi:hypothetical protein
MSNSPQNTDGPNHEDGAAEGEAVTSDRPGGAAESSRPTGGGKTLAGKLMQFSSGLSLPFIQPPVMTTLLLTNSWL